MKNATKNMSVQESAAYLTQLDHALTMSNAELYTTIHTASGLEINQNPNLDGFIAEQYHAQTFNLNAAATGSPYRADVLIPGESGYVKNSVDLVIKDSRNNHIVRRYQSKYCKDAESTMKAFENGDYRGQRKLVADGQEIDIKNSTNVIKAPDGTSSKALSKQQAKILQEEAQSGNWNKLNWDEYKSKDLAIGISKQAGFAAVQGAAIATGFHIAKKIFDGEKIEGEEVVETALTTGVDIGVKAAASGALKVGVEKGFIPFIAKGTPAGTIAGIANVAIENVKVLGKMASGELTANEGLDKMGETTVSTTAGLVAMVEGSSIGAAIGTVLGPIGSAIGGFIGGTVSYIAGSKLGKAVYNTAKKVVNVAKKVVSTVWNGIKEVGSAVWDGIVNLFSW